MKKRWYRFKFRNQNEDKNEPGHFLMSMARLIYVSRKGERSPFEFWHESYIEDIEKATIGGEGKARIVMIHIGHWYFFLTEIIALVNGEIEDYFSAFLPKAKKHGSDKDDLTSV